jgi:hypothetical protein
MGKPVSFDFDAMADLPALRFYCDESSHTGSRYAAVSGILITPERASTVNGEIARIKAARGKRADSEIKWANINKHDLPLYRDIVHYFGSLMKANYIHYHIVICDMHAYDHRLRNEGSRPTTVSKTYYQLLLHRCCRLYGDKAFIHVRPDKGECTQALPGLLNGLNADAKRRFNLNLKPILSIDLIESVTQNLMQMNDVILGAVASHRNERHKKQGASPHKTMLAEEIRAVFRVPNFTINTSWEKRPYTVWNWRAQTIGRPRS